VSLAQEYPVLGDCAANLERVLQRLHQAQAAGSDLVVFPELMLSGYKLDEQSIKLAEPVDGPLIERIRLTCNTLGLACVISLPEQVASGPHITSLFIDSDGSIRGRYRKTHLYADEKQLFTPGDTLEPFETSFGKVGMMICYDLEFPEVSRRLTLAGAELLIVATANMTPFADQQAVYVRARAFENEVPVVICNRVGTEPGLEFCGGSAVAHPDGGYFALGPDRVTLATVDVELGLRPYGYLAQRRPGLYSDQFAIDA
jgi:predicted amidohydrolase